MPFVETYADIKARSPFSVRHLMRGLALDGLALMGNDKAMRQPRVQFLYIHHTFMDEMPNLEKLLDVLQKEFEIISHGKAVELVLSGQIDKPYLSISSDDGFKNNLEAGRVMAERGISACFFINPKLIGENDQTKIASHCAERLSFPPVEFLSWEDVSELQSMGHEIGSHTMDHMNIGKEPEDHVVQDIQATYDILKAKCGSVEHFAWPYGLFTDFNESARKAVFAAGFQSCSSAERGCHGPRDSAMERTALCIRRDHVILDWKLNHIRYFLRKSAEGISPENDRYPY